MTQPIPAHLAVEDDLSEAVLRRILIETGRPYSIGTCYLGHGSGYLKKKIAAFNQAARATPFVVLTDLDAIPCAPDLLREWLADPIQPNLILRVAVREVEAWLLADRTGLAEFLNLKRRIITRNPESLVDPKAYLIDLASESPHRDLRSDIVPPAGSTSRIGPNYNGRLISFVRDRWSISVAKLSSTSLLRTVHALSRFNPSWHHGASGVQKD